MRVWNWLAMTRVLSVTQNYIATGGQLDKYTEHFTGPALTISQLMGYALHSHGIMIPRDDTQLLTAAWEYGAPLPVDDGRRVPGALLERFDGTLALALDRTRTIESAGTFPVIVSEPEPGRYVSSWECPGVMYLGGRN